MAEFAGSLVGIISLSIQVCKGLTWYIDSVKDGRNKAAQISDEMDRLTHLLELLELTLGKINQGQVTVAIQDGISACATALVKIRKLFGEASTPNRSKLRVSIKALATRFSFPFRESELIYWRSVISNIQQSLQIALNVLQIDQQRKDYESVRQQIDQLCLTQKDRIVPEQTLDSFQDGLNSVQQALCPIASDISHLKGLAHLIPMVERMEARLNEITPPSISAPVLETDVLAYNSLRRSIGKTTRRSSNRLAVETHCSCQENTQKNTYFEWPIFMSYAQILTHRPDCPFAVFADSMTDIRLRFSICTFGLRRKFNISIALAQGSGVFDIKPSLLCHRVVEESAPAFDLIRSITKSYYDLIWRIDRPHSESWIQWENGARDLCKLFETGKASPHDRLVDGRTLLHYLCDSMREDAVNHELKVSFFLQCMRYMPKEAYERDDKGQTCIDHFFGNTRMLDGSGSAPMVAKLLQYGLELSVDVHVENENDFFHLLSFIDANNTAELSNMSKGKELVLLQDEMGLINFIMEDRDGDCLRSEDTISLCKLASAKSWLRGCEILVNSGLKLVSTINHGRRPLLEQIFATSIEQKDMLAIARLWLDIRDNLGEDELRSIGSLEMALLAAMYYDKGQYASGWDLTRLVLSYLVNQRTRLYRLAVVHLGSEFCTDVGDNLLDVHAQCAVEGLAQKNVDCPLVLKPLNPSGTPGNGGTVYDPIFREFFQDAPEMLDFIYDAGFRDVGQTRCMYCSESPPISVFLRHTAGLIRDFSQSSIKIAQWCIEKGASLDEKWPDTEVTALQCLGWEYGQASYYGDDEILPLLSLKSFDDCYCLCNSFRCSFLHTFWKGRNSENRDAIMIADVFSTAILSETASDDSSRWNIPELIRLRVFETLGLRHTCCDISLIRDTHSPIRYPPKQAQRIRNEDAYLGSILEDLLPRFIEEYDSFEGNLQAFDEKWLTPKMEEVLRDLKEEDSTLYAAGRLEMGVVMEATDSDEDNEVGVEKDVEGSEDDEEW